jgi:hypothetical protein
VAQHGIDQQGGDPAPIDGAMGHPGGDPDPEALVLPQGDAAQLAVLEHHQIDRSAQHEQLIGLEAVAEELEGIAAGDLSDQGFVAGAGGGEHRLPMQQALHGEEFHGAGEAHDIRSNLVNFRDRFAG